MAYPTSRPSTTSLVARLAGALARGIERHGRRASRRDAIEAMERKSDAELARMGLRRADIPRHVYHDLYYI
jgi:uncharacterized protein YjiS (DUF1127 family)